MRDRTTRKGARNGRLLVRNERKSDELGRGRGESSVVLPVLHPFTPLPQELVTGCFL